MMSQIPIHNNKSKQKEFKRLSCYFRKTIIDCEVYNLLRTFR